MRSAIAILAVATLCAAIPVNVMLPLDMIDKNGLRNPGQLKNDIQKLKDTGIHGVMTDVWWGLTEPSPMQYNFSAYDQLLSIVSSLGLKLQVVMSFHQCGGNVGDTCDIPLPSWVLSAGRDAFYRDREGNVDFEYVTLAADEKPAFSGRTALEAYADYMDAFANHFSGSLGSVIEEIQVGLGPCGEMRYPSYPSSHWKYCGIGEFQCYDPYMLADLKNASAAAGHSEWGNGGPSNAGQYNSQPPSSTGFFTTGGFDNYQSDYGRFFLGWYTDSLLSHAARVLSAAQDAFSSHGVTLASKISGVHWWYGDNSHAAEMTAGYYNANGNDAYALISAVLAKHGSSFDFTCLEMTDAGDCGSRPATLVGQAFTAARNAGIHFHGENALELCNPDCYSGGFDNIVSASTKYGKASSFTYLRLTRNLVDRQNNLNIFRNFVNRMASA